MYFRFYEQMEKFNKKCCGSDRVRISTKVKTDFSRTFSTSLKEISQKYENIILLE